MSTTQELVARARHVRARLDADNFVPDLAGLECEMVDRLSAIDRQRNIWVDGLGKVHLDECDDQVVLAFDATRHTHPDAPDLVAHFAKLKTERARKGAR